MSMDQQLIEELYGADANNSSDEETIKEAQAELIEAVADEAGIDLNELDDGELDKFAEYVLSPEDSPELLDPNLATADAMGRQMAHSYADEQMKIAAYLEGDTMFDYDDVLLETAEDWELLKEAKKGDSISKMNRQPSDKNQGFGARAGQALYRGTGLRDLSRARELGAIEQKVMKGMKRKERKALNKMIRKQDKRFRKGRNVMDGSKIKGRAARLDARDERLLRRRQILTGREIGGGNTYASKKQLKAHFRGMPVAEQARLLRETRGAKRGLYIRGGGRLAATGAILGGGAYLAKKSSYDPALAWIEDLDGFEFAKEAELRAAEILLANGVDPETFEATYPEHVKLASFPEPEDAIDYESAEEIEDYNDDLDDAALDILDELGFLDEDDY